MFYILDENRNPKAVTVEELAQRSQTTLAKKVAFDTVGDVDISTVFLGLDHSFGRGETPTLFETMTFSANPGFNEYQWRYATWDEAVRGHNQIVERVKNKKPLSEVKTIKLNFKCGD